VTAVKAFYTDYGVYPVDPASTVTGNAQDAEYGDKNGAGTRPNSDVVNVLRADQTATDTLSNGGPTPLSINTRQQIYLDVPFVKDVTNPKSGLSKPGRGMTHGVIPTSLRSIPIMTAIRRAGRPRWLLGSPVH